MSINDGGAAFPTKLPRDDGNSQFWTEHGMRDYFAGQMLAGVWANPAYIEAIKSVVTKGLEPGAIAGNCYEMADAMLNAREEQS